MITLKKNADYQEIIKKSRFICRAARTDTVDLAMKWIGKTRDRNATHSAWAYRIGPMSRYNDDGEPGGTAGKPILSVIERQNVDHITVMVIRFFGGVKLGAGGLIRAYGGAAAGCLRDAVLEEIKPRFHFTLTVPFARSNAIYTFLESCEFHHRADTFRETGLMFDLIMDQTDFTAFKEKIMDLTAGESVFVLQSE